MLLTRVSVAAVFAAAALFLSSCTTASGVLEADGSSAVSDFDYAAIEETAISGADVVFVEMMIPHHSQALVLGELADKYAEDERVKRLAAEIVATQTVEIDLMEKWRKASGTVEKNQTHSEMKGMLTDEQFAKLESLRGRDFDVYWLECMIEHHAGAVLMVDILRFSDTEGVLKFAEHLVEVQESEIAAMEVILAELSS